MSTISVNSLLQSALVEFLSNFHYEKHLRNLRKNLQHNKLLFYRYLELNLPARCKVEYHPSGYFLWLKLPKNVDSMYIYEALIQQKIGIAPGQLFNITAQKQHYLRINCSFAWSDSIQHSLDKVISTLQSVIVDD